MVWSDDGCKVTFAVQGISSGICDEVAEIIIIIVINYHFVVNVAQNLRF